MFRSWLLRRDVQRVARLSEGSVEGTVVRVTGTVLALSEPLIAPCSGRPCVAFGVQIRTAGIMDFLDLDVFVKVPEVIVESREFALELAGGDRVVIDPTGSRIYFALKKAKALNTDRDRIRKFRARHQIDDGVSLGTQESVVEPGALVCVAGMLVRDPQRPDGEIAFRTEPVTRARIIGDPQRSIRIVAAVRGEQ